MEFFVNKRRWKTIEKENKEVGFLLARAVDKEIII